MQGLEVNSKKRVWQEWRGRGTGQEGRGQRGGEVPDMKVLTLKPTGQPMQSCSQSTWPLLSPRCSKQKGGALESSTTFPVIITKFSL